GGSICLLGQGLIELYKATGFDKDESSSLCSMTLVLISAVMTATGLYSRLAKIGEAGTLVPITGFANGIASSAIEFKAEGWISGIGSKIFAIAGPVILYGTACSVAYGVVLFTMHKLG
ncbi:MAG: SpoVA/SpoVAEb family sporulation membrane protein, partial [Oscillospiraceae bacterium]|nr:SpoVA/SpoVAEb family sporulation membrane protein [Oscillospiraceae bacterium]